jgi:hypothetical protein
LNSPVTPVTAGLFTKNPSFSKVLGNHDMFEYR